MTHSLDQESSDSQNEGSSPILQIWGNSLLSGEVSISGAKNAALVIMAGALLCSGDCRLRNIPDLVDVAYMKAILASLGVQITQCNNSLEINASDIRQSKAPSDLVGQLRASFFLIGPLLARLGVARIPLPGGCKIGSRPVDLHIRGLQAMGADVRIEQGIVRACIKAGKRRLQGANIYLDCPSVGATETLIMAATLADGETIIGNAAQEPEVVDLANFCRAMGARIRGAGTQTIVISGVPRLHTVDYSIIPDRVEAGTFLVAGAITHSPLSLTAVNPHHMTAVIDVLRATGSAVFADAPDRLRIVPAHHHTATTIETLPYPGFPTDMQAQLMAMLALCNGTSTIVETIFENRLRHVPSLNRMGANISVKGNRALIQGVSRLSGATVVATDLRASAALVLAGLAAEGKTTIQGLHHLDRGYEKLAEKLQKLGARLERIQTDPNSSNDGVSSHPSTQIVPPGRSNHLYGVEVA